MAEAVVTGATGTETGPAARRKLDMSKGPKEDITGLSCPVSSRKKKSPKGGERELSIGDLFTAIDKVNRQRKEDKRRSRSGKIPIEKSRMLEWDDKRKEWTTSRYEWDELE